MAARTLVLATALQKRLRIVLALALANTYHPGLERGVGPAAGRITFAIAQDAGYDVLREFWPEIAQKFKLPFRDHQ